MADIFYEIEAFTNRLPNGLVSPASGRRRVAMKRLAWAAAALGGGSPFSPRLGRGEQALETQWRMAMVRASVPSGPKYFYRSRSYKRLAPSEKGAVSFFLGQAQAKLFADEFFRVSKFVHYDHYLEYLRTPRARTRPDFLGFHGTRIAIAVEAKGRSGGFDPAVVNTAKTQAQSIPPIAGYPAPTTYVHLAYFQDDEWCAYLEDPPRPDHVNHDTDGPTADPEILTLAYYHPIVAVIRARRTDQVQIDGVRYLSTQFEDVDTRLLVRADIAELVPQDEELIPDRAHLRSVSTRLYEFVLALDDTSKEPAGQAPQADSDEDDPRFVGNDGIGVELGPSWLERRAEEGE